MEDMQNEKSSSFLFLWCNGYILLILTRYKNLYIPKNYWSTQAKEAIHSTIYLYKTKEFSIKLFKNKWYLHSFSKKYLNLLYKQMKDQKVGLLDQLPNLSF